MLTNRRGELFFVKQSTAQETQETLHMVWPFCRHRHSKYLLCVSNTSQCDTNNRSKYHNKIEVKDYSLSNLNFTWNDTIFEVLGDNLVLLLNFENLKTLGENNTLLKI